MESDLAWKPAPGEKPEGRKNRRLQLIEATIQSIADFGLSRTTTARVAKIAGLSGGTVNFHFAGKDALLLATLQHVAAEFEAAQRAALAGADNRPREALLALIDASFDPVLSDPRKMSVWYGFWGEARARAEYLKVFGAVDRDYQAAIVSLCRTILDQCGQTHGDAEAIGRGLGGLIECLWQNLLAEPRNNDREEGKRLCRAYLASVFPGVFPAANTAVPVAQTATTKPETLPAWVYDNVEFFELERRELFLKEWQICCHVSDVPAVGDYASLDLLGERAFVVRGKDDRVRAFHNVCRHRAHAVVTDERGNCPGVIRCPYHGWMYDLDGTLKAVPAQKSFPPFDSSRFGLVPLKLEIWQGFVFLRFSGKGPSVAERMAPFADELAPYGVADMQPIGEIWEEVVEIDWKNVWDNYLEDYHFASGHPGLFGLMGRDYDREAHPHGVSRLSHVLREKPAKGWSIERYHSLLPDMPHLPAELKRRWSYFSLFPGVSFDVYPESVDFFQFIPLGPGRTRLRGRTYGRPDERRETRAARYLNRRINWQVQAEDRALTASVQCGLGSSSYTSGLLSDKEVVLCHFQDWVRSALPVAELAEAPAAGDVARVNADLARR